MLLADAMVDSTGNEIKDSAFDRRHPGASHVDFVSLELDAAGTVNRQEGVTRFTEIVLRPRLVVVPGTDRERALRMLEKSEKHCLVSASLSTPIRVEPAITES